ncbi:MAG TPA: hydantoinase B/oxoprolinase family protein, partial [Nakamurella sp.]
LADAEPVRAGEIIRIRTTGGGGWGDPLSRPPAEVLRDVRWRKVSVEGARRDYGVVLAGHGGSVDECSVDEAATAALRTSLAATRPVDQPFFDRGPGYARLSGGRAFADVDYR